MKETKSIASFFYNKTIVILWLLFAIIVGLHIFWILKATGDGKFFLSNEDEVIYYCSAKVFSATNSVQAESCIEENVSRIGKMNWYGPGYSLVYGSLFKIVGSSHAVFPWFHFALAMAMLGLSFLLPLSLESRLLIAIALSVTQQFCVYIYTFFPETLILFLATVLTLLLTLQFYAKDERQRRSFMITFVICTLLFMLCRITFIFWFAGLIALADTRRSAIVRTILFVAGVVLSLIYMKLFVAPPWAGEMHKIDLMYNGQIDSFIFQSLQAFFNNLKVIFIQRTSAINVLFGLILAALIGFILSKNKLLLATLLISCCLLSVMFAYYSVYPFFFIKQTAMLAPLLLVSLIAAIGSRRVNFALLLTLMLVFPSPFSKTNDAIKVGRGGYEHYNNNVAFMEAFSEIPDHIQDHSTVILWCYREYDYGYAAQALLPFSTRAKKPILYTTNIVDPSADPQTKFQLHNRLKVDYILSRHAIPWPNAREVHATDFYHLYKLNH